MTVPGFDVALKTDAHGLGAVDRPGGGTDQGQCHEGGDVEEIAFVPGGSELGHSVADAEQRDRAEPIRQVNREDRHRQEDDAGDADEANKGADQDGDATQELSGDRDPSHQQGCGNAEGVKDRGERFRPAVPFREAVGEKSAADDQAKGDRRIGGKLRRRISPNRYGLYESGHGVL